MKNGTKVSWALGTKVSWTQEMAGKGKVCRTGTVVHPLWPQVNNTEAIFIRPDDDPHVVVFTSRRTLNPAAPSRAKGSSSAKRSSPKRGHGSENPRTAR